MLQLAQHLTNNFFSVNRHRANIEALFGEWEVEGGERVLFVPRLNFKPFHVQKAREGSHVSVEISSKATDFSIGNV